MTATIKPHGLDGSHKTGSLHSSVTLEQIEAALGFAGDYEETRDGNVTASWGFTYNGEQCGIWDFKGARWSTFGPAFAFTALFGERAVGGLIIPPTLRKYPPIAERFPVPSYCEADTHSDADPGL